MWSHPEALHPPAPKLSDTSTGFQLTDDAGEEAVLRTQTEKLCAVKPKCIATLNGQPVNVKVNDSKLYRPWHAPGEYQIYAQCPPAPWVSFTFELPPGRNEVAITIEWPKDDSPAMKPDVGWWLWAENPLQQGTRALWH